MLARCGVPALDLTPSLSEALRRGEVDFFPRDQHYTVAGNRRIAQERRAFLRTLTRRLNLRRRPGYTRRRSRRLTRDFHDLFTLRNPARLAAPAVAVVLAAGAWWAHTRHDSARAACGP